MAGAATAAGDDTAVRLLAACVAESRDSADGTFYLSGRTAAGCIGIPHRTAARMLRRMVESGSLLIVEPGTRGSLARRATVYRLGSWATVRNAA
jgi:hypothetical protein